MSPRSTTHLTGPQFYLLQEVFRKGSVQIHSRWQTRVANNLIDRGLAKYEHADGRSYLHITEAGMTRYQQEKRRQDDRAE